MNSPCDSTGLASARPARSTSGPTAPEVSRGSSLFNDALYIRRSVPDGVRTIGRGALISIGPGGEVEVSELDHDTRNAALVETFGLSEEIVSRVPPDGEGFALG